MKVTHGTGIVLTALVVWGVLGFINVHWADLNQDEGWYLYAAEQVTKGRLPYRDFAYTQGPVMPIVYAMARPLVAEHGLVAGRWFTFALSGLALGLTALLAGRSAAPGWRCFSAVVALVLLGCNVYHSQFTTTVKTYALCSAFLVAGLVLVQAASARRRPLVGMAAGVLLALAAGTRLSAGVVLPVACLYLVSRRTTRENLSWLDIGLGGAVGLVALFLPFLLMAPEGMQFGLLEYHAGRATDGLLAVLIYKGGFVSRFAGAYLVAAVAAVAVLLLVVLHPGRPPKPETSGGSMVGLLWLSALAMSVVHLAAPFPYDDYQVVTVPIFCAAIAGSLAGRLGRYFPEPRAARDWTSWIAGLLLMASIAASFSSPVNQEWAVGERDRIWWRLKEVSPIERLREAAAVVREHTEPDDLLLTQDIYLAVEAGRQVPRGMEMGPFCYYPEMDSERAERLRVLNRERFFALIESTSAPLAAFSGYGLSIASPAVAELPQAEQDALLEDLLRRYAPAEVLPYFGQAHTTLRFYRHPMKPDASP